MSSVPTATALAVAPGLLPGHQYLPDAVGVQIAAVVGEERRRLGAQQAGDEALAQSPPDGVAPGGVEAVADDPPPPAGHAGHEGDDRGGQLAEVDMRVA